MGPELSLSREEARATELGGFLLSAFEDAPIGMALVGIDASSGPRLLRVNPALSTLTGRPVQELEGSPASALLHPGDLDAVLVAMAQLGAGEITGFRLEERLVHAGRHAVWVILSASVVRGGTGGSRHCIWQILDIDERKRFEGELGYLAEHDPLTGLLNRRGFVRELTDQLAQARRYGGGGAVLLLDIDDFKYVNDTLGHSVGDQAISNAAHVLAERVRTTDVCARLGGDEFGVLLPHATLADAENVAGGLLEAIRDLDPLSIRSGRRLSASVGLAVFQEPSKGMTADDILIDADLAMYAAKEAGKDRYAVASLTMHERHSTRITWADRVSQALVNHRFELYCQPIVDLDQERIAQWELLLRLPGENGELILPAQFLYTAERSGAIIEIDRWVVREATRLIATHAGIGHDLTLAVNLSGRSVVDPELPGFIEQQLDQTGVDPARLVLEVTEAATIANMSHAGRFAAQLKELGCQFALDDFGAGFGSFYYLKYIPFDYVKIDGEFIRNLPASSTDQLILDSIVQMSRGLGKRTIAEFVGDDETVAILKAHGADYAQGYHLGRPTPAAVTLAP